MYLGVSHVIVGDVDISVADAAILEVKADIVIANDIPLEWIYSVLVYIQY